MKLIGIYDYTVILTYASLISGVLGMRLACIGELTPAILCLMISGVCDMFDGVVARTKKNRTQVEKSFGIQIDSLSDVICFGVAPAVFLYFCGVNTVCGIAALVFYILCAAIRLAFFNVLETKRQMSEDGCAKEYRGLPVTTAAIIFPIFYLLAGLIIPSDVMNIIYHVLPVLMGVLFISDFRIPKLDIAKSWSKLGKK